MREKSPLPRLASDPDRRLVRWGWIAWGVLTLVLLARWITLGDSAASALGWAMLAPTAALWLLWPLMRGAGALWRHMHAAPYRAWEGSYFEFDGRQIRVLFADDAIYVVTDDVFAALGLGGDAVNPAHVRLQAGRDGLCTLPGRPEVVFSERGLRAWLERRSSESAVGFHRWFEREVVAPYRKRRELITGRAASSFDTSAGEQ